MADTEFSRSRFPAGWRGTARRAQRRAYVPDDARPLGWDDRRGVFILDMRPRPFSRWSDFKILVLLIWARIWPTVVAGVVLVAWGLAQEWPR